MGNIKRQHPSLFKAKVALELIKGTESVTVICSRYSIHPTQARRWKEQALNTVLQSFAGAPDSRRNELVQKNELIEELYKQVGQLKVELDWLKKKFSSIEN